MVNTLKIGPSKSLTSNAKKLNRSRAEN